MLFILILKIIKNINFIININKIKIRNKDNNKIDKNKIAKKVLIKKKTKK